MLLRPAAPVATWGWLPLLAGVAVRDVLPSTVLKWPNDVLCGPDERKLAGILAQVHGDAVVIGIGLNVSLTEQELPVPTTTSLALCAPELGAVDRTALLADLAERLDARAAQWDDVGGDAAACGLHAAYTDACATLGRTVAVTTTDGKSTVTVVASDGTQTVTDVEVGDTSSDYTEITSGLSEGDSVLVASFTPQGNSSGNSGSTQSGQGGTGEFPGGGSFPSGGQMPGGGSFQGGQGGQGGRGGNQ